MSTKFYGNCENCGKNNLRATVTVHIHEIPGTHGYAEWCLDCIHQQEKPIGREKKASTRFSK